MYGMFCIISSSSLVIGCLFLFLLVILLLFFFSLGLGLLTLRCLWVSLLLAWSHSAPLGQLGLGSLVPLSQLLFPDSLQPLSSDDLGSTLVQLLPVSVCPGVCPPLVLGEHVDGGRMSSTESLRIKTLLDGFVSKLKLSPLVQFLELVVLVHPSLFIVVFVCLQLNDGVPDSVGLVS